MTVAIDEASRQPAGDAATSRQELVDASDRNEDAGRRRDLIVLMDGTNNTITGGVEDTNVLRLCAYLNRHRAPHHRIYYDPGVGSPDSVPPTGVFDWLKRTNERVSGLALGRGVYEDVEEAYRFLMHNWRDNDDRIYVFGFSRGAFTARAVVGIVNLFGILRPEQETLIPSVVRVYFSLPDLVGSWYQSLMRFLHREIGRKQKASAEVGGHSDPDQGSGAGARDPRTMIADQIRGLFTDVDVARADIHWVGVWDTVESVGLPGPLSQSNPSTATLKPHVRNVRHALAFDEHRWSFVPRLYEEPGDVDREGQTLKQRWFPGSHCDVGGSYPMAQAGLSEAALKWMIDEVRGPDELDLPPYETDPSALRVYHDATYDLPWWALAGLTVRSMQPRTSLKPTTPIAVIPAAPIPPIEQTVWAKPRAAWPVVAALVGCIVLLGLPALLRVQRCVLCQWTPRRHLEAAYDVAAGIVEGLGRLEFGGLAGYANPASWSGVELGWIVLWDIAFVLCWGYVLARIASRAFAWLVAARGPQSRGPALRWLGMMPLTAVAMTVTRDVLVALAAVMPLLDAYVLYELLTVLTHVAGFVALIGLLGCVPLVAIRLYLALPGVRTYRI